MNVLADVLKPAGRPERIAQPADETFVTVKLRSGGAVRRTIGSGKTPVPFTGYRVKANQFIYSRIDARNGAFAFIPEHLDGAVVSKDFPVFDVRDDTVDRSYLSHFFRAGVLEREIRARSFGATNRQRLDEDTFLQFPIALPQLDDQRRIAAILDTACTTQAKMRHVLSQFDTLAESLFFERFGRLSAARREGRVMKIGDLALTSQYGTATKASSDGAMAVLRMGNITDAGRIDTTDLKYIDLRESEIPKYTVRPGDMLFNRTNSADKVGKAAVVRTETKWAYAGYLIRVRFDSPDWAEYVAGFLRSPDGMRLRRAAAKTAVNQANINAHEMQSFTIPRAREEQVQEYAAALREIERQREAAMRELARTDELFAAVQSRAFRGEL